jgi:hypothetical protein
MTLKTLVKKIIPLPIKRILRVKINKFRIHRLKIKIVKYLRKNKEQYKWGNIEDILSFYKNNSFSTFPYNYTNKYKSKDVVVYADDDCNMKYVLHDKKRMYFKMSWSEETIKKYYNDLLIEQDIDSPHRYEYNNFQVNEGDIVVDVGVAEGNFALSVVERAKKNIFVRIR